jgi:hypothetical protein
MRLEEINKGNLIDLAINSSDTSVLEQLSKSNNIKVRRAVARNRYTSASVLERLLFDPVLNVSYMASLNSNNILQREFDEITHPCVLCTKDESSLNCSSCKNLSRYYN